ncbi:cell growth-regulating nucleolar protein-like [Babylonia areolata]|uniref:cell growth-regulating nucleolar protein-like n=1 Tax=Babylonia areolata TaxID=304850 RepID=UPI003FD0764D
MVFFTCGACNETLKKNQVEKHYTTKCRRCEFLSCIDCGKEFWGDSYQTHIKCVSEEEKYSGKNFVAKPNKGEVKQEQWIQKVQAAIQKAPANPQLKNLLHRLEDFPNVPRKKAKFENFLKCSLRVLNKGLMDQVWDLLMAEAQQQNGSNTTHTPGNGESQLQTPAEASKPAPTAETADLDDTEQEKKMSKRERKENRKKKMHKAEKKDKQAADAVTEEEGGKRKGKRRKREEDEEEGEEEHDVCEVATQPKKKKRKGENGTAMETEEAEENGDGDDSQDSTQTLEKKGKFNWGQIITAVLRAKGEMSVKRLQKKVLAEYASYENSKPEDRVVAKFNKKLSKLPNVKVLKDKAKLKS